MRFELFDACVHLRAVLVKKRLDRPDGDREAIKQNAFDAHGTKLLVERLASVQPIGRDNGALPSERRCHFLFYV